MTGILGASLLNLAATLVSLIAGFVVSIIVARLLGPEGSGAVAYALWLVMCASVIADRGLPQTVLRYVAAIGDDEAAWKPLVRAAFLRLLPTLLVFFLLFLAYGIYLQTSGGSGLLLWSATGLLFLAYTLCAFSTAAARGRGLFRQTAASAAIGSALQMPLAFFGAMLIGPAGALLAMLTRYLPQSLCLFEHVDRRVAAKADAVTPDMRKYGRSLWASDVVEVVFLNRVEYLVIGFFLSQADLGFFAAAVVFSGLVGQMTYQLSPAFLVGLTGDAAGELSDAHRAERYRSGVRFTALFVMPIGLGGAAVITPLVPIVFGEAFLPSAQAAALFLIASVPTGLTVAPWAYLAAKQEGRSLMNITLASAGFIFLMLVAVVPFAGVIGAAVVRMIAEFLNLGLLARTVRAHGGPALPWNVLLRTFAAAAACGAVAFAIAQSMPTPAGIGLAVAAGVLVYAAGIRLLRLVCAAEMESVLNMVRPRLPARLRPMADRLAGLLVSPAG